MYIENKIFLFNSMSDTIGNIIISDVTWQAPLLITKASDVRDIVDLDLMIVLAKYGKSKCLENADRSTIANAVVKSILATDVYRM